MPDAQLALLEDEPLLRVLVAESLQSEGYAVREAVSYEDLLHLAADPTVAAVVADFWGRSYVDLSDEDAESIRVLAQAAPTVLVSGRAWLRQVDAHSLGLVAILPKPYDLDALLNAVALAVARARRE